MTVDTAHLRALAEAATQGLWAAGSRVDSLHPNLGRFPCVFRANGDPLFDADCGTMADAVHIAANSPDAALAMCDEIDRLRADVEHLQAERDAAIARAEEAESATLEEIANRDRAQDALLDASTAMGGPEWTSDHDLHAIVPQMCADLRARAEEAEAQVGLERATEKGLDR